MSCNRLWAWVSAHCLCCRGVSPYLPVLWMCVCPPVCVAGGCPPACLSCKGMSPCLPGSAYQCCGLESPCLSPTRAAIWYLSSSGYCFHLLFCPSLVVKIFTWRFLHFSPLLLLPPSFLVCLDLPRPPQDCIHHPYFSLTHFWSVFVIKKFSPYSQKVLNAWYVIA